MTSPSNDKYADLEKQIDEILSDGKFYLFPPGLWLFLLVNVLMMIGVGLFIVTAQDVLFDQIKPAMIFSFVAGIVLALVIVTPPFLVIRGFRKALSYLKVMIVVLSVLILVVAAVDIVIGGPFGLYAVIGFLSMASAYFCVNSSTYQLLSLFTARRRELALRDLERKKEFLKNR